MEYTLSLPVQELIRASERVITFATNHKGLTQKDFEAVLLCAHELLHQIKASRALDRPQRDIRKSRAA